MNKKQRKSIDRIGAFAILLTLMAACGLMFLNALANKPNRSMPVDESRVNNDIRPTQYLWR